MVSHFGPVFQVAMTRCERYRGKLGPELEMVVYKSRLDVGGSFNFHNLGICHQNARAFPPHKTWRRRKVLSSCDDII